jgi:hypothetical protein
MNAVWLLVWVLIAQGPTATIAFSAGALAPGQQPVPQKVQPLPSETARQADLALEEELKRQSAQISGERIGTDGAAVSQTLELGLIFTRNLWAGVLRGRASRLEQIKRMSRGEKLALIDQILKAAPAIESAYQNMIAAQGPAINPVEHEKTRYEGLLKDAEAFEKNGNTARAAEARDRANRSLWKFYLDRHQTFFGLLERDEASSLAGLYTDNWVMPNRYLFQTLRHTLFSTDSTTRADEKIAILDGFLDANINRLGKLADDAEAITEFKDLLEYASPKYARVHQIAIAISQSTPMTLPALLVYPLVDVGRSYAIATQMTDTAREILVSFVCLASLGIPVVGVIVNAGVAIIEVVNEGGHLVVSWVDANDARRNVSLTGESYVLSEDEKTRARAGRLIFAVVQAGTSVPFVGPVIRDARAAQIARLRRERLAPIDAPLADAPSVQRGARKAREMGMAQERIDAHLTPLRTKSYEEHLQKARELRAAGVTRPDDKLEDIAESLQIGEWNAARVTAEAFSQIDRLETLKNAAFAAGVAQSEIDAMVNAARAVGTLKALGQELPANLLRATINRRGITVVVDKGTTVKLSSNGIPRETQDVQWEELLDFFAGVPPSRVLRADMHTILDFRSRLQSMQEGRPVVWSRTELESLEKMLKRPDLGMYYELAADDAVLLKIFDDTTIEFGRRFMASTNRTAIANGRELLPPVTPLLPAPSGPVPIPYPSSDPLAHWVVTGSAATGALGRWPDDGNRPALDPGSDPFSAVSPTGASTTQTSTLRPGARRPSTLELEQAAFAHVRSAFGSRTVNWTVQELPDGQLAVTSADGQRRVIARSLERNGEYRIVFTTEKLRGRFIDHTGFYNGVYLELAIPSPGQTVLPSLGVPTRPPTAAPQGARSAGVPSGGAGGSQAIAPSASGAESSGVVPAAPHQAFALPNPVGPSGGAFAFSGGAGGVTPVGSANIWEPKVRTRTDTTNTAIAIPTTMSFAMNNAVVTGATFLETGQHILGAPGTAIRFGQGQSIWRDLLLTPLARLVRGGPAYAARATDVSGDRAPRVTAGFSSPWEAYPARAPSTTRAEGQASAPGVGLKVFLTTVGNVPGNAFKMVVVNESGAAVQLAADPFVLEPIQRVSAAQIDRELQRLSSFKQATSTIDAYCLEIAKLPPTVGTVFRIANQATQARFGSTRPLVKAAQDLMDAGKLVGGKGDAYLHAARQWAVWSLQENFDEGSFGRAFIEHSKRNLAAARRPWTREIEGAIHQLLPGRWRDVKQILDSAASNASRPAR